MQMTFRWFGKDLDTVSLEQIKQIPGVVGVVPALHYLPAGKLGKWKMCRKCMMKSHLPGLQWNVSKA